MFRQVLFGAGNQGNHQNFEKSFIFDTDLGLSEDFGDNLLKVTVAWSSLAAITFD